jgi:hypothetical protein
MDPLAQSLWSASAARRRGRQRRDRVGRSHVSCVTTIGAKDFRTSTIACTAVLHLRDGDLTGQFVTGLATDSTTGAITGGTGAYANARGVITSTHTDSGSDDTITLVD